MSMENSQRTSSHNSSSPCRSHPSSSSDAFSTSLRRARSLIGMIPGSSSGRSMRGKDILKEDDVLVKTLKKFEEKQQKYEEKKLKTIVNYLKDTTCNQCLRKCKKFLTPTVRTLKVPWSKEEDEMLVEWVNKHGKRWSEIAHALPGRNRSQCRDRWNNHLDVTLIKEQQWTPEEDLILIYFHQIHGNNWAHFTKYLPGRTNKAICRHWNDLQKNIDSNYIFSGLLDQFQRLVPILYNQNQLILPSSFQVEHIPGGGKVCRYIPQSNENSRAISVPAPTCSTRNDAADIDLPHQNNMIVPAPSLLEPNNNSYFPTSHLISGIGIGMNPADNNCIAVGSGEWNHQAHNLLVGSYDLNFPSTYPAIRYGRSYSTSALNPSPFGLYSDYYHQDFTFSSSLLEDILAPLDAAAPPSNDPIIDPSQNPEP